jgi:branched-chain amino acid transport system permease protein
VGCSGPNRWKGSEINLTKRFITSYSQDIALLRTRPQWATVGVFLALLIILPLSLTWANQLSWLTFINFTMLTVIAVLGLHIMTGLAGQTNMGHAAFIMVGGFTTGVLTTKAGWPFWAALPIGALITAMVGLVVGAPSMRLRGFYLAVATMAFFYVSQFIIRSLDITGGMFGLSDIAVPSIGSINISTDMQWYYLILAFVVVFTLLSLNLRRSRLGRAFIAVRDNELTAASLGINVYATKLQAFFLGAFFAGVAGGLWTSYITVVRVDQFTMWDSILYLGMIIIGGGGSAAGAILGVIFLRLIGQLLHIMSLADWAGVIDSQFWLAINNGVYGLIIILFVTFQPHGLMAVWRKISLTVRRWPFP